MRFCMAFFCVPKNKKVGEITMPINLYTLKARLTEIREEIENHANTWADIPGGASNPIAQADLTRLWKELETLAVQAKNVAA